MSMSQIQEANFYHLGTIYTRWRKHSVIMLELLKAYTDRAPSRHHEAPQASLCSFCQTPLTTDAAQTQTPVKQCNSNYLTGSPAARGYSRYTREHDSPACGVPGRPQEQVQKQSGRCHQEEVGNETPPHYPLHCCSPWGSRLSLCHGKAKQPPFCSP